MKLLLILALLSGAFGYGHDGPAVLPDPSLTPGATNPAVTQSTIKQTICVRGWTGTVRPPERYTEKLKLKQMEEYGDTVQGPGCPPHSAHPWCYEEDHLISLELGGSPTSPRNLWPEPYVPLPGARQKDKVENYLHRQVCSGKILLGLAQGEISGDWYSVFERISDSR